MLKKAKELIIKYKDIIFYGIFGVLTTIANIIVYHIMAHMIGLSVMISTIIAWIVAVFFAYITNRRLVFHSQASNMTEIIKEIISFFSCRILTGFVDLGLMFIFVNILNFNDTIIKTLANIIVIVLNYVASKLIIFKQSK